MSDAGRKNLSDKLGEAITPEDQKSYYQQGKEAVTDAVDKAQSKIQPDSAKSTTQQLGDSVQSGHDDAKSNVHASHKSFQESANEYAELAKHKLNEAAEYVSGTLTGAKEGAEKGSK